MTIPADIREKAEQIADEWRAGASTRISAPIARAILEERERCVRIAERHGLAAVARVLADPKEKRACHESVVSAASAIASAIRNEEGQA